jgi:hypothetical protein
MFTSYLVSLTNCVSILLIVQACLYKKTWSLGSFALSIPFLLPMSTIGFFCITASLVGSNASCVLIPILTRPRSQPDFLTITIVGLHRLIPSGATAWRLVVQYSLNSQPGKLLLLTRSFLLRSRIQVANGRENGGLSGRFRMGIQVRDPLFENKACSPIFPD